MIDAWWDDRVDRRALNNLLDAVAEEVRAGRAELSGAIDGNRRRMARMNLFLAAAPEALRPVEDSTGVLLISLLPPGSFDPGGNALESLLAGGNLSLISSPRLRNAVVAWGRLPDELVEDYEASAAASRAVQEAAATHGLFLASHASVAGQTIADGVTVGAALESMRRDLGATDAVARLHRHYEYFVRALEEGLVLADELLDAIANERSGGA